MTNASSPGFTVPHIKIVRNGEPSQEINNVTQVLRVLNPKGYQNRISGFKVMVFFFNG